MEPLNHLMAAAQSQNIQRTEPNANQRHVQQQNVAVEQQQKVQETVNAVPQEANDSDEMMALRNGMGGQGDFAENSKQQQALDETPPEKALLDEGSGQKLDILG